MALKLASVIGYMLFYKFVRLNDIQSNMQAAAIPNIINSHINDQS